jgi:predicted naringenin-chalcone synthase
MDPAILALATAEAPFTSSKDDSFAFFARLLGLSENKSAILKRIYENSAIAKRHLILPLESELPKLLTAGMSERNTLYRKEAPKLAEKAARGALEKWGKDPREITHLISVSCTGVMSPGIEVLLSSALGLDPSASLLGINLLGCFGAFKALKVAAKIAKEHPKQRILLVSVELCSLHIKPHKSLESLIIQSLFADGAAAAIIGGEPAFDEKAAFFITKEKSELIPDTGEELTWHGSDEGFDMHLSPKLPALIGGKIAPFTKELIAAPFDQCEWAIHPGGRAIVEEVEKELGLTRSHTASSWNVLSRFGNMSSATLLYILNDIFERNINKTTVALGFGPGLAIEGLVLKP